MKKLTYKKANEITNQYGYAVYKHGKNDPYFFPCEDSDSPMLREDSLNTYTLDVWTAEELERLLIERIHESIMYRFGKFCNDLEL